MSTREFRQRLTPDVPRGTMCWGSVWLAFGIDGFTRQPGGKKAMHEINNMIRSAGYEVEQVQLRDAMPDVTQDSAYTLAAFLGNPEHLKGDWILSVSHHVLCVRDGKITDTMGKNQTVARRLEGVYRVTKPGTTAS